jgi:anti-sigma regulatory factor (Ser/Thr protein kinase)
VAEACIGRPEEVVDAALLLTSEIVTNAVRHGRGSVRLGITMTRSILHVEVSDGDPTIPIQSAHPDPDGPGGRGLLIVAALATSWGSLPHADGDGKTVWFELRLG